MNSICVGTGEDVKFISKRLHKIKHLIFYKLSVKKRLMLFFAVIIIIPLLSVSLLSYFKFSDYVEEKTVAHKMEVSSNAFEEILSNKSRDESCSDQVLSTVKSYLVVPQPYTHPYEKIVKFRSICNILSSMEDMVNVSGILVIGEGKRYFYSNTNIMILRNIDDFNNSIKYQDIIDNVGRNIWVPLYRDVMSYNSSVREKPFLYVIRKIYQKTSENQWYEGYTIIQLKQESYFNIMERSISEPGEYAILVDDDGIMLCNTKNNKLIGTRLEDEAIKNITEHQGSFRTNIDDTQYLIQYTKDKVSGWSIIQYIPFDNILEKSREIRDFTFIIMGIFLVLAIALSFAFSRNMSEPLNDMIKAMDTFGEGDLKLRIYNQREDEFGQLYNSFNNMAEEIKSLFIKIEENNKQRRMLEFSILEYQINPHFLYNTLESINWIAQKAGHTEIGEIVSALAKYFRLSLSSGNEMISIENEIEHVRNYILIYQYRYMGSFQFEINIDEEILQCKTIKLILQPLVENAIKHGIQKNNDKGWILINGRLEKESIVLEVEDNGKGIEESILLSIKEIINDSAKSNDDSRGIGLLNVNRRIKLCFGDEYGIDIDSQLNHGTIVRVKIPIIY